MQLDLNQEQTVCQSNLSQNAQYTQFNMVTFSFIHICLFFVLEKSPTSDSFGVFFYFLKHSTHCFEILNILSKLN